MYLLLAGVNRFGSDSAWDGPGRALIDTYSTQLVEVKALDLWKSPRWEARKRPCSTRRIVMHRKLRNISTKLVVWCGMISFWLNLAFENTWQIYDQSEVISFTSLWSNTISKIHQMTLQDGMEGLRLALQVLCRPHNFGALGAPTHRTHRTQSTVQRTPGIWGVATMLDLATQQAIGRAKIVVENCWSDVCQQVNESEINMYLFIYIYM